MMETETSCRNERSLNLASAKTISVRYRQTILELKLRSTVSLIQLCQILWVGGRRHSKLTRTLSRSNIKTVSIANTQGGRVLSQRVHHEVIVPYASAKRTQPASPLSLEVTLFKIILRMTFLNHDQWYRNLLQHTQSLSSSTSQLSKELNYLDTTHHFLQRQRDHHHM